MHRSESEKSLLKVCDKVVRSDSNNTGNSVKEKEYVNVNSSIKNGEYLLSGR